jgi:hypothetical protein
LTKEIDERSLKILSGGHDDSDLSNVVNKKMPPVQEGILVFSIYVIKTLLR